MSIAIIGSTMMACSDTSGPQPIQRAAEGPPQLAVTASDPGSGLVAAYGFNETGGTTILDMSSFGRSGTFGTGVTRTTAGRFGGALTFSGNGMATIPDAAQLRLTTAMTLEAWVNPSAVSNVWRSIIYKGDDNYYLMATSTNASRAAGGASFGNTSATTEAYGTSALPVNAWTHLAVTYDGAMLRLYVNGAQVSTRARSGSFTTSANPLRIGGNEFYGQYFRGRIDEVRIYNRTLSAGEIQADMSNPIAAMQSGPDTSAPTIQVTSHTGLTYTTTASAVTLGGAASDNVGVEQVGWANDRGGTGFASGTTAWVASNVGLQPGTNVITVAAVDAARNVGMASITIIRNTSSPATQLTVTTQPSTSTTSGAAFAQQPSIQLRDASGAAVGQAGVVVTASIASGGGTLGGATTATTTAAGVATFTNLSISGPAGTRTLRFTSGSLAAAPSNEINVVASGPTATKLLVSNIGAQTVGRAFSVTVTLADASNNPVANSGGTGTVRLTRQSGTGIVGGTTSGTIPVGASSVTISGVTYSTAESGVVLLASGTGFGSAVSGKLGSSNAFSVASAGGGDEGDASPPGSNTYTTNFPLTEWPISEGGRWLNGGQDGGDWADVSIGGGRAIGHQTGASYSDATALLTGTWAANQQATATVFTSGTVGENCYAEVELRLRSSISSHSNRGYEVGFKVSSSGAAYMIIVRWNGPFGNFTYLSNSTGAQYGVRNGDVIKATIVGNVITAYKNGVVMGRVTDGAYTSGSPGMGFNLESSGSGCAGINDRYGFSQFSATGGIGQ